MEYNAHGIANGKTFFLAAVSIIGMLLIILAIVIYFSSTISILIVKLNDNVITDQVATTNRELIAIYSSIVVACVPAGFITIRQLIKMYYNFRKEGMNMAIQKVPTVPTVPTVPKTEKVGNTKQVPKRV